MRAISSFALATAAALFIGACSLAPADAPESEPTPVVIASDGIASWAVQLIREYLDTKPWGFFGATCEQWLDIDYAIAEPTATIEPDGRIHVALDRDPNRSLGPRVVRYYVDLDSAEVVGDHSSDDGRLGTTEGCDQW